MRLKPIAVVRAAVKAATIHSPLSQLSPISPLARAWRWARRAETSAKGSPKIV